MSASCFFNHIFLIPSTNFLALSVSALKAKIAIALSIFCLFGSRSAIYVAKPVSSTIFMFIPIAGSCFINGSLRFFLAEFLKTRLNSALITNIEPVLAKSGSIAFLTSKPLLSLCSPYAKASIPVSLSEITSVLNVSSRLVE